MRRSWGCRFTGATVAVLFFWLSLTPSLLPRSWLVQGSVSGLSTAVGYGMGLLAGRVFRLVAPAARGRATPWAWRVLAATGVGGSLVFMRLNAGWQREMHHRLGAGDALPGSYLAAAVMAAALFIVLAAAVVLLRAAARRIARLLGRWIQPGVASVSGTAIVVVLTAGVLDGVVLKELLRTADGFFEIVNETARDGFAPPASPMLSGGPGSLLAWDTLGVRGQDFVTEAAPVSRLEAFSGRPATEPIRVYASLRSAEAAGERAALAVGELERTGAFSRRVLAVMATTGTGWVNPTAARTLEYMYDGDTALVAMQYSYLPSWIAFLVDQNRAAEAGQELFDQVYDRWVQVPTDQRPLLLVFGESLGSFAAEAAFSGVADMGNRVDGALYVGPLNFNPSWRALVEDRDPGTPQRLPVFEGGRTVRFAAAPGDFGRPAPEWPAPRVAYLQHASDPVVWWSPRLIVRRPDWLAEPRGDDVLPAVRWYPFVTFLQLSGDLTRAGHVPPGHGHLYSSLVVEAWAAIAAPPGWSPSDTARLQRLLED